MITERKPLFVRRLSRSGAWTLRCVRTTGPPDVSRSVNRYESSADIVLRARSSADRPDAGSEAGRRNETGAPPARTATTLGRPWSTVACTREHPVPQDSVCTSRPSTSTRTESLPSGLSPRTAATSTGPPGCAARPISRSFWCLASASVSWSSPIGRSNVSEGEDEPLVVLSAEGLPSSVTNAVTTDAPSPSAMMPTNTAIQTLLALIGDSLQEELLGGGAEVEQHLRAGPNARPGV